MTKLNDSHETSLRRLSDTHKEKIALLDRQFLQQKQQLMRAREAAIWEMEERQLHEKHQLAKRQLKDMFFLQRHQMLVSHTADLICIHNNYHNMINCSGSSRKRIGAFKTNDGSQGGGIAQKSGFGKESFAKENSSRNEGKRNDVQGVNENISHKSK